MSCRNDEGCLVELEFGWQYVFGLNAGDGF